MVLGRPLLYRVLIATHVSPATHVSELSDKPIGGRIIEMCPIAPRMFWVPDF